ncbi:MAG: hypothetical protein HC824_01185 [Synechococcales cyanobacterium RM1_1_8]|nr:hypothetical protein [Synechococcales cyanobacterium RM1_1_8]
MGQPPSRTRSQPPTPRHWWVLPPTIPPYAPELIYNFVQEQWRSQGLSPAAPTLWIGFSAGVVGAIATARRWQRQGGEVRGMIALDGWGVPLGDGFPRYRLSHDRFTAQSCEWLGASDGYFYAEPGVEHLALWRSPQLALGHWHLTGSRPTPVTSTPVTSTPTQPLSAAQLVAVLAQQLLQQPGCQ